MKYVFIIMTFLLVTLGCEHSKRPFIQRIDECTSDIVLDESSFYPFDTTHFELSEIKKFFPSDIKIDSVYNNTYKGDTMLSYTFHDRYSKIVFSLNELKGDKRGYNIPFLSVTSKMITFNNEIEVLMQRSEFFKALRISENNCDTFDVKLDQFNSGRYLRFVFVGEQLKQISKEYVEM